MAAAVYTANSPHYDFLQPRQPTKQEHHLAFDSLAQRRIMGHFATGVTVVTTRRGDHLCGLTANAVASLSLDPPLVLVAVEKRAHTHGCLTANRCFAVNMLTVEQEHISRRFASREPKEFKDLAIVEAVTGAPILADALAWIDCRLFDVAAGGDHDIFIGEIVAGDSREGSPLLYFRGKYGEIAPPAEMQA